MTELTSLGLDIGSSTTKLVLCRLRFENVAPAGRLPRFAVTARTVLYAGPLHPTPLGPAGGLDVAALERLVTAGYAAAGVEARDVRTGAVIVTGESAMRENAPAVVARLARHGGSFAAAVAGPDLEGVLAARGAGAAGRAQATGRTIAHVDIGGATANVAVFAGDRLAGTCTLMIGGGMVGFDAATGRVVRISHPLARYCEALGLPLALGDPGDAPTVAALPAVLAETFARCLDRRLTPADACLLLGHAPDWDVDPDEVSCSGGVMASPGLDEGAFHDLGQALARAFLASEPLARRGFAVVPDPGRATVLGAGARSTDVSGATVHVEAGLLPARDLPVCRVAVGDLGSDDAALAARLAAATGAFAREAPDGFALALGGWPARVGFAEVRRLARALAAVPGWRAIVMSRDLGQVLGQCLAVEAPARPVVCLDGIAAEDGDYLDLGTPLAPGGAVPLVIKTLVFPRPGV